MSMLKNYLKIAVVGVVKDFHFYSLHHRIEPLVLFPQIGGARSVSVRIRAENTTDAIAFLETQWLRFAPDRPFDYSFLDDALAELYVSEERVGEIFRFSALLAIVIACLGLFGLAAFTTQRRLKEIGVRKILGASVAQLLLLLTRDVIRLVGLAFVVGAPVTYLMMRQWLDNFAYRVDIGPRVFVASIVIVASIALLTVSYQAMRAALSNPVHSLRHQ